VTSNRLETQRVPIEAKRFDGVPGAPPGHPALAVPGKRKDTAVPNLTNTLIAVAIIDREGGFDGARMAARYGVAVKQDIADVADLFLVLDADGVTADAAIVTSNFELEDGTIAFRVSNKPVPADVVGLDFSEVIGRSTSPLRLLEVDVDAKGKVAAAAILTAPGIKAAKAARGPQEVHLCGAEAFYGPCRVKVSAEGELCSAHAGHLCGFPSISDGRPCRMSVSRKGQKCALHADLAKKAVA